MDGPDAKSPKIQTKLTSYFPADKAETPSITKAETESSSARESIATPLLAKEGTLEGAEASESTFEPMQPSQEKSISSTADAPQSMQTTASEDKLAAVEALLSVQASAPEPAMLPELRLLYKSIQRKTTNEHILKLVRSFTTLDPVFRRRSDVFANRDLKQYRNDYPNKPINNPRLRANLDFYSNTQPSRPRGGLIDDLHRDWRTDYEMLERHHGYIQWWFPIHEKGMSFESQVLQRHEREHIRDDPALNRRLVTSYEIMLGFYGFELKDRETGEVVPLADEELREDRFENLSRYAHNYLRITRISKCLGLHGLAHYQVPFMTAFLYEIIETQNLINCASSCGDYWIGSVLDDGDRQALEQIVCFYSNLQPRILRKLQKMSDDDKADQHDDKSVADDSTGDDQETLEMTSAEASPDTHEHHDTHNDSADDDDEPMEAEPAGFEDEILRNAERPTGGTDADNTDNADNADNADTDVADSRADNHAEMSAVDNDDIDEEDDTIKTPKGNDISEPELTQYPLHRGDGVSNGLDAEQDAEQGAAMEDARKGVNDMDTN